MNMMRWDPFEDMAQLRDQVNRLFSQTITGASNEPVHARSWSPAVEIYETEQAVVVLVEVPGMKAEDIDIRITGDTLTIHGDRKLPANEDGKQYLRVERNYGPFHRSFTLGLLIDQQKVNAGYHDGLLEVTLPKQETVKSKQVKIEIQSASEPTEPDAKG